MEGLSGSSDDMAAKRAVQTLVVPVVAKGTNGSVSHLCKGRYLNDVRTEGGGGYPIRDKHY